MSRELDDLYRETLDRIRKQPGEDGMLGMRVLSWITHTRRPLSVEELRHGLAVEYDDDDEPDEEFDPENLLSPRSLVDVCAGLVVIDPRSQIIRLVHYTTQEFFNKERLHLFEDAENDISTACLTYLSYNAFTEFSNESLISETLRLYPFLAYAALNWVLHISSIEPSAAAWSKAVLYVNNLERMLFSSMILRKLLLRSRSYSRLTKDAIRVRLAPLPLECASECGQLLLVKFILDNAEGSEAALDSSLHCASAEGHALVVKTLIESGAKAASLSSDSSSTLLKACKGGHVEVARLLVENGANANTPDRWMWTPLHYATHGSHSALVAFLIGNGSNPNAQTPLGMTPCHLAASRGDIKTVKIFIDSDFDLKVTTRYKRTVLHSAAEGGHLGVLSLLLASGSDALAKDKDGRYARDLMPAGGFISNGEIEVKGIFAPYMKASLENQDDIRGPDEVVDKPTTQPSQTEPEEPVGREPEHLADINRTAIRSWEYAMTSSEEEAGAQRVWEAPRLRLIESTPPDSPTGSDTERQANGEIEVKFEPYMEASLENQDDIRGADEVIDKPTTQPSQTEPEEPMGREPEHLADINRMAIHSWEHMTSSEEEAGAQRVWEAPRLRLIESTPPDSPTGSDTEDRQ